MGKGTASSSKESGNESLVSKAARPTNARKKALATALQVNCLFLQNLNLGINSINSWLNSPHKNGSGNLTEMIQNKLHSETHTDKLLNCGPPLQDPLGGYGVKKILLNVIHHALQHLQEMLPGRTTKVESLHKITTVAINHHQVRNAVLEDSEAMEIRIRRPRAPEICRT